VAIFFVVIFMPKMLGGNQYWVTVLALLAINVLLVSSLRSVTLINEISLGQVGFVVIGAYVHATLMMKAASAFLAVAHHQRARGGPHRPHPGLPVPQGERHLLLHPHPAHRRDLQAVAYYWTKVTGGSLGLTGVPGPGKESIPFVGVVSFNKPGNYYYIAIVIIAVALLILYYLERAYIGFQWRAIKDDNTLAGAVGINVIGYKTVNFVIAAFHGGSVRRRVRFVPAQPQSRQHVAVRCHHCPSTSWSTW